MSKELYRAAYTFVGHLRGGLAMATVLACGGFGAICGSSIATAATMAQVAYPSMRDHGYGDDLAAGSIAAGGTLGILIPPSTHDGDLRHHHRHQHRQAVRRRRAARAGRDRPAVPGGAVHRAGATRPPGRAAERAAWRERLAARQGRLGGGGALRRWSWAASTAACSRPPKGAGVGAFGAFVFALRAARSPGGRCFEVLVESARTTAMLFMILVGALVFTNFLNYTTMPGDLKALVVALRAPPGRG